jgi:hypothetical protein
MAPPAVSSSLPSALMLRPDHRQRHRAEHPKRLCGWFGPDVHLRPCDAGWSSLVARRAHNPKVGGSNPPPATEKPQVRDLGFSSSRVAGGWIPSRFHPTRRQRASNMRVTRFTASCVAPGSRCPYVSKVKATVACPSRSETTLGWMPAWNARVANVCRRS